VDRPGQLDGEVLIVARYYCLVSTHHMHSDKGVLLSHSLVRHIGGVLDFFITCIPRGSTQVL
jgi:hypothetical protein